MPTDHLPPLQRVTIERAPDRPALRVADGTRILSYGRLGQPAHDVADTPPSVGVIADGTIDICCDDRPEFFWPCSARGRPVRSQYRMTQT